MTRFRCLMDEILTKVDDLPDSKKKLAMQRLCVGADKAVEIAYKDSPEMIKLVLCLRETLFDLP
jgi:hypothetical protein